MWRVPFLILRNYEDVWSFKHFTEDCLQGIVKVLLFLFIVYCFCLNFFWCIRLHFTTHVQIRILSLQMFSSSSPHTQFQFSSFSLCLILKFKKIPHVRNVSWCNDQSMWSGWPWDNPLRLACSRHQSDISQTLHDNNSVELYPFLTVLMTLI